MQRQIHTPEYAARPLSATDRVLAYYDQVTDNRSVRESMKAGHRVRKMH